MEKYFLKTNSFAKTFLLVFCIFLETFLTAQNNTSTQPHNGTVTSIVQSGKYLFTSGNDGFVIKWDNNFNGEHFQLSNLEIHSLAIHPNGKDIAIYETDGFSIYRLSVWNWAEKKLKFSKRFTDSITTLSYSSKGTYLIAGTSSVDGLFFLDQNTGNPIPLLKEQIGVINMAATSKNETSCVFYSPSGFIYYANMLTGAEKARIDCPSWLESPFLFNNNLYLAGYTKELLYIVHAVTGEVLTSIQVNNPIIVSEHTDKTLTYIDFDKKTNSYTLKNLYATNEELKFQSVILKSFTLDDNQNISFAKKIKSNIFIGSTYGNLYKTTINPETSLITLNTLTSKAYKEILDINTLNDKFLFLTADKLFSSSYIDGTVTTLVSNTHANRITSAADNIILWTKDSKEPVFIFEQNNSSLKSLYTPDKPLVSVNYYNNTLILIEGNSTITSIDLKSSDIKQLYNGTGIQDGLITYLKGKKVLVIAKTASSNPKSSLLLMDMETEEIVPLPIDANIVFSLTLNKNEIKPIIYGISNFSSTSEKKTEIFSYNLDLKFYSAISYWQDEDTVAFITFDNDTLYSNIGKNNIFGIKLKSRKQTVFQRVSSLPKKIVSSNDFNLILNQDGSLSWFSEYTYLSNWLYAIDDNIIETE